MVDGDLEMEFWIEKDSEMIEWNGLGADEEAQPCRDEAELTWHTLYRTIYQTTVVM